MSPKFTFYQPSIYLVDKKNMFCTKIVCIRLYQWKISGNHSKCVVKLGNYMCVGAIWLYHNSTIAFMSQFEELEVIFIFGCAITKLKDVKTR